MVRIDFRSARTAATTELVEQLGSFAPELQEQWTSAHQDSVEAAVGNRERDLPSAVQTCDEWTAFLPGSCPGDDATLVAVECVE